MSNKVELLKSAVGFVAGLGVSHIVTGIIESTAKTDTNYQKAATQVGKVVVGMIVSDIVRQHTDAKVESAVTWVKNVIENSKGKPQPNISEQN